MANRPMNAQILTDTLFNEGIKKPAIQRALDPEGFDHERAWRAWVEVLGRYLALPAG